MCARPLYFFHAHAVWCCWRCVSPALMVSSCVAQVCKPKAQARHLGLLARCRALYEPGEPEYPSQEELIAAGASLPSSAARGTAVAAGGQQVVAPNAPS